MSKTTKHTVTTLLSADGVALVEDFLKWFWDSFDGESFTRELMHIFSVYVEHCTKDCHYYQQPQFLTRFISNIIQTHEQLREIALQEKPWGWDENEN